MPALPDENLTTGVAGNLFTMDLVTSIGGQVRAVAMARTSLQCQDNSQVQTRGDH